MSKENLLPFLEALDGRPSALRRDECGDWRIGGKEGHIYSVPGTLKRPKTSGFQIFCWQHSVRAWGAAKKRLSFCDLELDCETEGLLFLDRLPSHVEGEAIRAAVGIPKRYSYSPEVLAQKREQISKISGFRRAPGTNSALDGE